jgi:acyl-CoA thioesterase I
MNRPYQNEPDQRTDKPAHKTLPAILAAAILLFCLIGCSNDPASNDTTSKTAVATETARKTIVAVGDSLTAGLGVDESKAYPALLQKKLAGDGFHFDVVNAGVSGETSSGTLSRIQWVISSLKPDIIILETGANDGLRGIDTKVLRKNLDRIVSIIKAHHIKVLLCGMKMLPNLGPEYVKAFARVYPEVARKYDIPLVPFFLEGVAGDPRLNQPDGIHPTAAGYRRIVDHIYPYVLEVIKGRKTDGRGKTASLGRGTKEEGKTPEVGSRRAGIGGQSSVFRVQKVRR